MFKINRLHIYSLLAASLGIHLTVLNRIRIFGAEPDLMLIMLIFFALFLGWRRGLEIGVLAGFLKDIFAFDIFGVNTIAFAVTGFLAGAMNTKFFRESKVTQLALVFSFTIFSMWSQYLIVSFFSREPNSIAISDYLITSVLPASLYTSLISIPIFSKFIDIYNLKEPEDLL